MSSPTFDRRRSARFAALLREADGGPRHHRSRELDGDLPALVRLAQRLTKITIGPKPTDEFRVGLRALLLATAERGDRVATVSKRARSAAAGTAAVVSAARAAARTATARSARSAAARVPVAGTATAQVPVAGTSVTFPPGGSAARPPAAGTGMTRAAVLAGVTAGALALTGLPAGVASGTLAGPSATTPAGGAEPLPGDPLYQLKRSSERARLAQASCDQERGRLFLEFAQSRLTEARLLVEATQPGEPSLVAQLLVQLLVEMDAATRRGVRRLTIAAASTGDRALLDRVREFIIAQRAQLTRACRSPAVDPSALHRSSRLLDAVDQRVLELQVALRQGHGMGTVDEFGPRPAGR